MKTTKVLLLGAIVAACSLTTFAGTGAYLLSGSAASNLNRPADTTVTTIAYVASSATPISPRALANQTKIVKGVSDDQASTPACRKQMVTSPKAVAECASHATMPGCVTLAIQK